MVSIPWKSKQKHESKFLMSFKVQDYYFKKAKKENYLARSVYKLEEIDQKFKILKKGDRVLDLGYYPGSWVQYTYKKVGPQGYVSGVDLFPVNDKLSQLANVRLLQANMLDFYQLSDLGETEQFDVVLSDMAPKTSGVKIKDQALSMELVDQIFLLLPTVLRQDGHMVAKVFDSNEARNSLKEKKNQFGSFHTFRPKSTRNTSKEFFVIGKHFRA